MDFREDPASAQTVPAITDVSVTSNCYCMLTNILNVHDA